MRKLIIYPLMMIMLSMMCLATSSTFAVGVKQNSGVTWDVCSYSSLFSNGFSVDYSIYVTPDKDVYSDVSSIAYVYNSNYDWYSPPFTSSYGDDTPVKMDYCMVIADSPDEPSTPEVTNAGSSGSSNDKGIEVWFRQSRNFPTFKANENSSLFNDRCYAGGFTVYCYVYLDPDYTQNSNVRSHYGWTSSNNPNVDDVVGLSITNNCDSNTEDYCLIKIHYNWAFAPAGLSSTSCLTSNYDCTLNLGLNLTSSVYQNTDSNLNLSSGTINNDAVSEDDADASSGGDSTTSGDTNGGYQYVKVQEYLVQKEISSEQIDYLGTILNMMKLIFSLIVLIFYLIEFMMIIYFIGKLIPGMFKRIEDMFRRGGNLR